MCKCVCTIIHFCNILNRLMFLFSFLKKIMATLNRQLGNLTGMCLVTYFTHSFDKRSVPSLLNPPSLCFTFITFLATVLLEQISH